MCGRFTLRARLNAIAKAFEDVFTAFCGFSENCRMSKRAEKNRRLREISGNGENGSLL
jgi:hypothetical protein